MENWGREIPPLSHSTWWICGSSGIWFQFSQVVRYHKKRKPRRCKSRNVHILLTFSICTLPLSTYSVICSAWAEDDWCTIVPLPRNVLQVSSRQNFEICLRWKSWLGSFVVWESFWNQIYDLADKGNVHSKCWAAATSVGFGRSQNTWQSWGLKWVQEYQDFCATGAVHTRQHLWGSDSHQYQCLGIPISSNC